MSNGSMFMIDASDRITGPKGNRGDLPGGRGKQKCTTPTGRHAPDAHNKILRIG